MSAMEKKRKRPKIHPSLKARLIAVRAAFADERFINHRGNYSKPPENTEVEARKPAQTKHWRDALKDDDGETGSDGSDSSGTIKGFRGKDTVHAMRKLSRGR